MSLELERASHVAARTSTGWFISQGARLIDRGDLLLRVIDAQSSSAVEQSKANRRQLAVVRPYSRRPRAYAGDVHALRCAPPSVILHAC